MAPLLDLGLFLPPYDPPLLDVVLFWHRRHDENAAQCWLRQRIVESFEFGSL